MSRTNHFGNQSQWVVSKIGQGTSRVFHQIEFSTFPSWETYKNKYVGLKFDVEFEFEEKMTTFFSGKKVSLDINFEIFKFRDFSKKIQIEIFAKPTQFFYF